MDYVVRLHGTVNLTQQKYEIISDYQLKIKEAP